MQGVRKACLELLADPGKARGCSSTTVVIDLFNKTKVISADLLSFDFDFEDIFMFGNISVLLTFQYW